MVLMGQHDVLRISLGLLGYSLILFENLFKPRQLRLAVYMLLTSSVLSTTSKQCFEQPAASFLVCSLIFIEYKEHALASLILVRITSLYLKH